MPREFFAAFAEKRTVINAVKFTAVEERSERLLKSNSHTDILETRYGRFRLYGISEGENRLQIF